MHTCVRRTCHFFFFFFDLFSVSIAFSFVSLSSVAIRYRIVVFFAAFSTQFCANLPCNADTNIFISIFDCTWIWIHIRLLQRALATRVTFLGFHWIDENIVECGRYIYVYRCHQRAHPMNTTFATLFYRETGQSSFWVGPIFNSHENIAFPIFADRD